MTKTNVFQKHQENVLNIFTHPLDPSKDLAKNSTSKVLCTALAASVFVTSSLMPSLEKKKKKTISLVFCFFFRCSKGKITKKKWFFCGRYPVTQTRIGGSLDPAWWCLAFWRWSEESQTSASSCWGYVELAVSFWSKKHFTSFFGGGLWYSLVLTHKLQLGTRPFQGPSSRSVF